MRQGTERAGHDPKSLRATLRDAYRVGLIVRSWGWVERDLGREPTLAEFAEYWRESEEEALAEMELFHLKVPDEATPHRVAAALEVEGGRSQFDVCVRCSARLSRPPELTEDVRSQAWRFSQERGADSRGWILRYLVDDAGLPERDAKALALHVAQRGPACNWCGTPLDHPDAGGSTACRSCRSVNLIWG
jgi:ribosomal protein L40E